MIKYTSVAEYDIYIYERSEYNDPSTNLSIFSYQLKNGNSKLLVIRPSLTNRKMYDNIKSYINNRDEDDIDINHISRIIMKVLAKESRLRRKYN